MTEKRYLLTPDEKLTPKHCIHRINKICTNSSRQRSADFKYLKCFDDENTPRLCPLMNEKVTINSPKECPNHDIISTVCGHPDAPKDLDYLGLECQKCGDFPRLCPLKKVEEKLHD